MLMFLLAWSFLIFESTFVDIVIAGIEMAEVGAVTCIVLFVLSLKISG